MIHIYRGDTFEATLQLRLVDSETKISNPFPIPVGATVELIFPPADANIPVILSTANSGEITIVDADASTVSYKGDPSKSLLMAVNKNQSIDCRVITTGGDIMTTTKAKILTVEDYPNGPG